MIIVIDIPSSTKIKVIKALQLKLRQAIQGEHMNEYLYIIYKLLSINIIVHHLDNLLLAYNSSGEMVVKLITETLI